MKALRRLLLPVAVLAVVLAVIGVFLPPTWEVQRSVLIQAKPEQIFPHVNELKRWQTWSAWTTERYPDMKVTFSGPESGVGAQSAWEGEESGEGKLTLTQSDPAKGIAFDMVMDHGLFKSSGSIAFAPEGQATRVTWRNTGDVGDNPYMRYFGLLMDMNMGPDLELGLNNLKRVVESR